MEGTHCTLQLHNPITELCYISFYLPKGEVRGFSYKGTVTLDRSNNAFHNCYQVREGPDITSLSQQPDEHPGDIFFKQTPTKDILTELYKLTAERERLLDSLLRSDHILGISMGNQEGKLQELSVSLAPEEDCFQCARSWSRELPVNSLIRKSTQGNKKPRRSGRRRDSPEELWQKRTKRKGRGRQESSAPQMGKDQVCSSNSLPPCRVRPNLRLLEERGNLVPQGTLSSSPRRRRESCPANILRTPDADLGFGSSGRTSEDTDLEEPLSPNGSSTKVGDVGIGKQLKSPGEQEPPSLPESHEKHPGSERVKTQKSKSLERTCRKKPVSKVVAKVQDLSAQVQRVVRAHPDGEEKAAFCSETRPEFIPKADFLILSGAKDETQSSRRLGEEQGGVKSLQPPATERTSIPSEPASTEGAVNKVLRKVIDSEKLDEATEGKTLGFSLNTRATHTSSQTRSQRKAGLPKSGHKFLLLDLPHTVGPDSPQPKCEEKKPTPQTPTALGMVFNNSSPQSSAHKRLSPVPSPLSPRCPSPQQHHRILLLPPLPSEEEAVFNECPGRKNSVSSGFPSAVTLEPSSSTKVTETKGGSPTSLRASQTWLVSEETSDKSLRPEKITAPPQHQPPPASVLKYSRSSMPLCRKRRVAKKLSVSLEFVTIYNILYIPEVGRYSFKNFSIFFIQYVGLSLLLVSTVFFFFFFFFFSSTQPSTKILSTINSLHINIEAITNIRKPYTVSTIINFPENLCFYFLLEMIFKIIEIAELASRLKVKVTRAGGMAQKLRALDAFPEVLSSIPSNHMVVHNHQYESSSQAQWLTLSLPADPDYKTPHTFEPMIELQAFYLIDEGVREEQRYDICYQKPNSLWYANSRQAKLFLLRRSENKRQGQHLKSSLLCEMVSLLLTKSSSASLYYVLYHFVFETWISLCSPDWSYTHGNPPLTSTRGVRLVYLHPVPGKQKRRQERNGCT
ncbi:Fmn1 [Phodopus roborovskii]|uniref:Fmn1 protein n=1 Tax=Phodopus roborovskii TaxID=109678 RepID=A0AAU9Z7S0_PHORO|nr:Fmn1 [Phodopus roborovskii]